MLGRRPKSYGPQRWRSPPADRAELAHALLESLHADGNADALPGLFDVEFLGADGFVLRQDDADVVAALAQLFRKRADDVRKTAGRTEEVTRALRQIEQLQASKQPLTEHAADLVLALA